MNRREVLTGMALASAAAAVPAVAMAETRPDSRAWDREFTHWCTIEGKFDELCDRFNAAEEAWGGSDPRVDHYFEEYNLNTSMKRGHVEGTLAMYNTRMRLTSGTQIDVQRVADEFEAYLQRSARLRDQFRVGEYWGQVEEYRPTYFEARDRIMQVPAPHVAALLVKIEIAAISLDEEHAEVMLAAARRLLSTGKA